MQVVNQYAVCTDIDNVRHYHVQMMFSIAHDKQFFQTEIDGETYKDFDLGRLIDHVITIIEPKTNHWIWVPDYNSSSGGMLIVF